MDSILSNVKECFFCKRTEPLHKHHIYEGRNRQRSEKNGFWCYLCAYHHNASEHSVHMDHDLDLWLKGHCQKVYEKTHTRDEFLAIIGRNYLED